MRRLSLGKWLLLLGQLLLVPALLLFVCEGALLNSGAQARLHETLKSDAATGLSPDDVLRASETLLDYLRGARPDIELRAEVYGARQAVFNEKEKAHMKDVRALFDAGRALRLGLLISGISLCALGLALNPRARMLLPACLFWLLLLLLTGLYFAADFERAFLRFHELLFQNQLWILNPETDLMIRLYPEEFFSAVAVDAGCKTGGALLALTALGVVSRRFSKKHGL